MLKSNPFGTTFDGEIQISTDLSYAIRPTTCGDHYIYKLGEIG